MGGGGEGEGIRGEKEGGGRGEGDGQIGWKRKIEYNYEIVTLILTYSDSTCDYCVVYSEQ